MSGPIVRRYGFPNFEKIFGERDLQHGADEPETAHPAPEEATRKPAPADSDKPAPPSGKKA